MSAPLSLLGEEWRPLLDVLESAPAQTAIFVGPQHTLVFQNAASRSFAGGRRLGEPACTVFAELPEYLATLDQVWESGAELRFRQTPLRVAADGSGGAALLVDAVFSPLRDPDGELTGVFVQAVDVTDRTIDGERLRVAQALNRVGLELSRSLDVDQVTASVTRLAAELFAGWGLLDLWQPDGSLQRIGATHHDPAKQHLIEVLKSQPRVSGRSDRQRESYAAKAARTGAVQMGSMDVAALVAAAASPEHAEVLRALQPRHFISVPVGREPRRLGALSIVRPEGEPPFEPGDRVVLEQFAERAAIALAHAGDYSEQRRAALTLQRSLLPANPHRSTTGLELAVRYRAGDAGTEVGGDWYDTLRVDPGAVAVVVGDVEGHDLEAAALMGQVRAIVHSHAAAGLPPARVAAAANAFVNHATLDRLVTMSYLQVDPHTRLITSVRAGHLPTVVVAPGHDVRLLMGRGGLPLGVDDDAEWQEETVRLPPRALIAVCSDGLVESAHRSAEAGLERIGEVLVDRYDDDVEVLADAVLTELSTAEVQQDDVVLVLLRLPDGGPAGAGQIVRRLPAQPSSAPIARWFLADILRADAVSDDTVETAALLVTELVSNAARHSDAFVELRISCTARSLRVGVYDESHRVPHPTDADVDDTSGRGLQLVAMLATSWGVDAEDHGKVVWFTLDTGDTGGTGQ